MPNPKYRPDQPEYYQSEDALRYYSYLYLLRKSKQRRIWDTCQ